MEIEFADRATEDIYNGVKSKLSVGRLPSQLHELARRKIDMMKSSIKVEDLRFPPGNRLEKLKGSMSNFYSIRINSQYRIVFIAVSGTYSKVEIVDYH